MELLVDRPPENSDTPDLCGLSEQDLIRTVLLSDRFYELHKQSLKDNFHDGIEPTQSRDFNRECPAIIKIEHLTMLLDLPGDEFIQSCYRMFLMREPDRLGRDAQEARLKSYGKFSVLQDVIRSEEFAGLSNFICISSETRDFIVKAGDIG
jgi:hypothetical protein